MFPQASQGRVREIAGIAASFLIACCASRITGQVHSAPKGHTSELHNEVLDGLSANWKLSSDARRPAVLRDVFERQTNIIRSSKRWLLSAFNWRVSTWRFGWGFPLTPGAFADRPAASITSDLPVNRPQSAASAHGDPPRSDSPSFGRLNVMATQY